MGIEHRTAETRKMFRTGGNAFALQPFQERARPANHLVSGPAPATFSQRVVRVRVEEFEIENRREINVDAELMQPAADRTSKILRFLDITFFLHVGNRQRFTNNVAQTIDAVVFLVNGQERTIGKL